MRNEVKSASLSKGQQSSGLGGRKIIVFNLISLDGFFAGVDGNIDWHNVDDEFNEFATKQTKSFGTILFGRTTYQLFESYWPKAINDKTLSKEDREIAKTIDEVDKVVFSKTLKNVTWRNTTLLHEVSREEIEKLKQQPGGDIVIFGSGTIVREAAKLGLVDEYRLMINPIVLGEGKQLFKEKMKLKLLATKVFKNGNVLITYSHR